MSSPPITRAFDGVVDAVNQDDMTIVARINTNALDRFNSVIDPKGAKLDNFRRNPICLWEHGTDPRRMSDPVGRCVWIRHNGGPQPTEILAKTRFLSDDFSRQRYEWYRDGILNAFSIRALPQEWGPPTMEEVRARPELDNDRANETRGQFGGPIVYRSWELAEYSGVSCGGNADCLVVERAAKMLDLVQRDLLWVPDDVRPLIEEKARTTVAMPGIPPVATDSGGLASGGAAIKESSPGTGGEPLPKCRGDNDGDDDDDDDEEKPGAPEPESRTVRKKGGRFYVLSESGKNLGDPKGYATKEEADHRLGQIEYFKHQGGDRSAPANPARDPNDPIQPDGHGGWVVRGLDGVTFDDEAAARRAYDQLTSPTTFEDIFIRESRAKQERNEAIVRDVREDIRAELDLMLRGVV